METVMDVQDVRTGFRIQETPISETANKSKCTESATSKANLMIFQA